MRKLFFTLLLLIPLATAAQVLSPAPVFTDNMVMQRHERVPVWGQAAPGSEVRVAFGTQQVSTRAGDQGEWMVVLDEMEASMIPAELKITSEGTEWLIRNVLVGEVWLCSGQSNMFWPLGYNETEVLINGSLQKRSHPGIMNHEEEIRNARHPALRLYYYAGHRYWDDPGWVVCSPETAGAFSATAYFFGRELLERLEDVPIGLIAISAGGTSIQKWMTEASALKCRFLRQEIENGNSFYDNPGTLFARFIRPVVPYALRGFIWYQGESNAMHREEDAAIYEELLALLIEGWREEWDKAETPFYFVQLPLWDHPRATWWHVAREAMRRVATAVAYTGMAVIYDFSDPSDLHPPEKQEVGRRLALWALNRDYGHEVTPSGPLFKSAIMKGNQVICYFDHARGLHAGRQLTQFSFIDESGFAIPAKASIEGETVVLEKIEETWMPLMEIEQVKGVSFFYGGQSIPLLKNDSGLPASPFLFWFE
jgi:sialate O-acetylesterase